MPQQTNITLCENTILEKNAKLVISRAVFNDKILVSSRDDSSSFSLETVSKSQLIDDNFTGNSFNILKSNSIVKAHITIK